MTENRMYFNRKSNVPVMRYCAFNCIYCSFNKFLKLSNCQECRDNKNHAHLEVLQRTPPKTKEGEFITIGLAGDVSFMNPFDFHEVLEYCQKWCDRTFLIQSKNPEFFVQFSNQIPDNVILGTTMETNKSGFDNITDRLYSTHLYHDYAAISSAPFPIDRYDAMIRLPYPKAITIEPILDFHLIEFRNWITDIAPIFCYIGYANDRHDGKKLKLPEPALEKTMQLISELKRAGVEVRTKSLRAAWWE